MNTELLGIYLNDHLTGAMAGTELARRISRTHPELRVLADDIEADRKELLDFMRQAGVEPRPHREALGWLTEKAGRLKFNGRVLGRSPLSDVLELETLRVGIEGKAALWRTLLKLNSFDETRLERLARRAESQAELVDQYRLHLTPQAFNSVNVSGVDVERTFTVASTPEGVIEYLRDFSRAEQWDPGTVSCTRLDDGPVEVGSRWRNVSSFLGRRTELVYELTRADASGLQFVGRNDTATSTDDISITAGDTPGTARIAYHAHVEFNGLAKFGAPVAKLALEKLGTGTEKNLIRVLGPVR
ncbi:Carbon monoxide dehydrogenase subunit G [Lentzea albidocapillata subsp. violacea]|uniref:Carbon monoxide dehydrogenase subunit G n=1 Tax=Lentzea albidocapillata subsp. violacea TaxID=128104 RepID=A0A1G9PB12_9PSEU|nr:SRPBCC family protein [Lentzea albidocapillata]SDL95996.1 Carbon monoxide dehydrogenase subunit G [Lentzea albidocapillata subsp. violacea]